MKKPSKAGGVEKNLGTGQLIAYQSAIGLANEQMDAFATDIESGVEAKQIGGTFFETLKDELQEKVDLNHELLNRIENELYKRIKRDFPTATLSDSMSKYIRQANNAQKEYRDLLKSTENLENKKTESKVLDLKMDKKK